MRYQIELTMRDCTVTATLVPVAASITVTGNPPPTDKHVRSVDGQLLTTAIYCSPDCAVEMSDSLFDFLEGPQFHDLWRALRETNQGLGEAGEEVTEEVTEEEARWIAEREASKIAKRMADKKLYEGMPHKQERRKTMGYKQKEKRKKRERNKQKTSKQPVERDAPLPKVSRRFFLDDVRSPKGNPNEEWTIARNIEEAIKVITEEPKFDAWHLDYDLGGNPMHDTYGTGLDFLDWAAEHARDKWPVGHIHLHSASFSGAFDMRKTADKVEQELQEEEQCKNEE